MRENRTSGSESGDWKHDKVAGLRPGAKATEKPPDPIVNAPVLDTTAGDSSEESLVAKADDGGRRRSKVDSGLLDCESTGLGSRNLRQSPFGSVDLIVSADLGKLLPEVSYPPEDLANLGRLGRQP